MGIEDELVTVAHFMNEQQFLFARGRLESAGIQCFTSNEHLTGITSGIYNGFTGGITLKVLPGDAEDARAILDDPGSPFLVK